MAFLLALTPSMVRRCSRPLVFKWCSAEPFRDEFGTVRDVEVSVDHPQTALLEAAVGGSAADSEVSCFGRDDLEQVTDGGGHDISPRIGDFLLNERKQYVTTIEDRVVDIGSETALPKPLAIAVSQVGHVIRLESCQAAATRCARDSMSASLSELGQSRAGDSQCVVRSGRTGGKRACGPSGAGPRRPGRWNRSMNGCPQLASRTGEDWSLPEFEQGNPAAFDLPIQER